MTSFATNVSDLHDMTITVHVTYRNKSGQAVKEMEVYEKLFSPIDRGALPKFTFDPSCALSYPSGTKVRPFTVLQAHSASWFDTNFIAKLFCFLIVINVVLAIYREYLRSQTEF